MFDDRRVFMFSIVVIVLSALAIFIIHKRNDKNETSKFSQDDDTKTTSKGSVALAIVVMLFFLLIAGIGVWISIKRYEVAGQALKSGNTGLAVAALAPEIGEGIGNITGGIAKAFNY